MAHREFKDRIYAQFARIGAALSSEKRLELIDLLAQAPRNVEALAEETGMSMANFVEQQTLADATQTKKCSVTADAEVQQAQQLIEGSKLGLAVHKQWLKWKVFDACPRSVGRMLR